MITRIDGPRPGVGRTAKEIAEHGYLEEEHVVAGRADLYRYDERWQPVVDRAGIPFTTRIVVRRPIEPSVATGDVVLEPLHPAGDMASAWPRLGRALVRDGWSWVGVTQDVAGLAALQAARPGRYDELDIPEVGLGYDIVARVAAWLRSGAVEGLAVDHLFMTGASYTGTFQRVFLGEGFHDRARLAGGEPVVEGYLIQISSGGFLLGGYNPLSATSGPPPADHVHRVVQPRDVPVVELLSEGEAETNLRSRRPDSDDPGDRYRLYEVGGACHMSAAESAGSTLPPTVEEPSDFPMHALAAGALHNLRRWAVDGVAPPRARRIELLHDRSAGPCGDAAEALPVARDADGNALGGVRTPELDVPIATYSPRSTLVQDVRTGPPGRPAVRLGELMGSMQRFPVEELRARYGTVERWREAYRREVDRLVGERWILPADAGDLLRRADTVAF